jgi:hypothetical protein
LPLERFNQISEGIPSSLVLRRDRLTPEASQSHVHAIGELTQLGNTNLTSLRRVKTPDPALRNMVSSLIQAQSGQIALLTAARRFLDSGDTDELTGPAGLLAEKGATDRSVRTFHEQQLHYLTEHGMISQSAPAER